MTNQEYAQSLRQIADFFEQHSDLPLSHDADQFSIFCVRSKAELQPWLDAFGSFRKEVDDNFLRVTKQFGSIIMKIYMNRQQTCKRVVVGTKKVKVQEPIAYHEVEREVEDVRWDCEPLLAEIYAKCNEIR